MRQPTHHLARPLLVLSPTYVFRCLLPELAPADPSTRAGGTRHTAGRRRALERCRNTRSRPKDRDNSRLQCPLDHLALATTLAWEWIIRGRGLGVLEIAAGALERHLCSQCSSTCRRPHDRWEAEVLEAGTTGVGPRLCEVSTRAIRPLIRSTWCFFFFFVFFSFFSWCLRYLVGHRFLSTNCFLSRFGVCPGGLYCDGGGRLLECYLNFFFFLF